MKAVEFKQVNVRLAEDQDEYETLPSYYNRDDKSFTCCFELSEEEIETLKRTGKIYLKQLTFGGQFAPVYCTTEESEVLPMVEKQNE